MAKNQHSYINAVIEYAATQTWPGTAILSPRSLQLPSSERAILDATALDDTTFQGLVGQFQEANAGFSALYDPADSEAAALRTALNNKTLYWWRATLDDGTNQGYVEFQGRVAGIVFPEGTGDSIAEFVTALAVVGSITES